MIASNIKWGFNQFELALLGFCGNIQNKIQQMVSNLPVFMINNGDFSYYIDKKFVQTSNEEMYLKTPRFVLKIDDFQLNSQEDTNMYNKILYTFDDGKGPRNYQAVVRRKAFNVNITGNFVSPNLIVAMNNMEVMATLMSHDNVFTYEFLGNTIQSAYVINQSSHELPSIDMGTGGTRNVNVSYQIELQVHLIVPRIESIIPEEETGFDTFRVDVHTKDDEGNLGKQWRKEDLTEVEKSPMLHYRGGTIVKENIPYK